ncbi:xanthine/uracil/vitamin C permease [Campylobacter pinnipediorum subsp. caledonicus]|uniref:Xanthine/uracil/vitamin C permease n=1 Tax=Campylobacter pinnipediorum subsp. caledonicus TaxID=1874362 RepID=A0A1S6U6E4_9BACT|nr:NCS2 family permease [Campylobacter pinnipediorum]AQW85713.1 xanthine/uracil/vitamin C permease [Campylobacter pinnipediorum subsp. caledonicus]AQW87324.1 xanthine/uracil/vitamin C permease [Campylobacter pinnipediorum subsp. caledonicus]OPA72459.1 guanine permease [Campylobacter pinnipediorum subsp. caledonicus]
MDFFKLKENNTSIKQEFTAGFTTFLAMMYIVPTNAIIMSKTGMPIDALITATALATILATVLNGLWANTPVAMSVGMGLNAYFTFGLVIGMNIPWQTALGIVFLSGILFVALSFTNFRIWVVKSIPIDLRRAISAGIGCFISFIGLQQIGIIANNDAVLVSLGDIKNSNVLLGIIGLLIVMAFWSWKIKGAFMLAVITTSIIAWVFGMSPVPTEFLSTPASIEPIFLQFDIKSVLFDASGVFTLALLPVIIIFFVTDLFDSIGTLTGVGSKAGLFTGKNQNDSKRLEKTLEADALATVGGSLIGVSTTTTFVESASGVAAGGRTGLTAVFCGLLFILTLFLLPFFKAIPANAIYPILVMVGVLMFTELTNVNFKDPAICVATFFIVILMPLTYSITNGLAFGFLSYFIVRVLRKEWEHINLGIIVLSIISFVIFLVH